jgi:hypothetical protein
LGDGFFPSIGAQVDTMPLLDVVRRSAEQAGREAVPVRCPILAPTRVRPSRSASRVARAGLRCQ